MPDGYLPLPQGVRPLETMMRYGENNVAFFFIASADTPPLEAGITSSGMKLCLDTPRLDAGSIEGFISCRH
jgi:hypothetical protein